MSLGHSPMLWYGGVGFIVGAISGFVLASSQSKEDLLIGAFLGLFIGVTLAMCKRQLWDKNL